MNRQYARSPGLLTCLLVLTSVVPAWASQAPFDRIVVFGTSLSDPGNYFALTHLNNVPPAYLESNLLVPGAAYATGGHHLSNGATWIEQLAIPLGLSGSVRPAFSGESGATDYAVNGARAYDDGINVDLSEQVNRFMQDTTGIAPPDALYVVEMGSNDVFDALKTYLSGGDGSTILQSALISIGSKLQVLYAAGARRFLIWNVPDVSLTPAVHTLDATYNAQGAIIQLARNVTAGFNAQLSAIVTALGAGPGANVTLFNAFADTDAIVKDPAGFGLTDVTDPCIMPYQPPFRCSSPGTYLFWDGIHPTKAGHAITAREAAAALGL